MLAGCESIQVFKNRLNENLSEMVQMKQSCLRNNRFGMETKLFYVLPLPSPHKSYCFVGIPHTFPRESKLLHTSLSVLQSPHLTSRWLFPLSPAPPATTLPAPSFPDISALQGRVRGMLRGSRPGTGAEKETLPLLQGWGG